MRNHFTSRWETLDFACDDGCFLVGMGLLSTGKVRKNEKHPSIWGVLRGEFVVFGRFDGRVFLIVFDSK